MKYYNYVAEMEKEAGLNIQGPVTKFKNLSLGKKLGVGLGVVSTTAAVGGAAVDGAKEAFKPIDTKSTIKTGFKNGVKQVNPGIKKSASAEQDSLASSKMKYLPVITAATTGGLIGVGLATGKINKDLAINEAKRMGKKVSKAYNAGSKVVTDAMKIAEKNKMTEELKKAFEEYKSATGNTIIELSDFKELKSAYESWRRKTGNTKVSLVDWAKKNAGKVGINNKNAYKGKNLKQKADMAADAAIKGAALGTATSVANFAVHEIGDEYFRRKDNDEVRRRFREDWNNNFTDNLVAGKKVNKNKNTGYKTPQQRVNNHIKKEGYKPKYINKVAASPMGEFVNHADDMIHAAGKKLKGKALFKDIVKNDVVKPAVTGVAYVGTPALLASAMKRDRNTLKKIENTKTDRVVIDVPEKAMKKSASFQDVVIKNAKKIKADYIPDNLGQEFVRAGIRGVAMGAPVAVIANKTNRNLRGNMEKLEDKNKALKPLEKGNVRITVERRTDNA